MYFLLTCRDLLGPYSVSALIVQWAPQDRGVFALGVHSSAEYTKHVCLGHAMNRSTHAAYLLWSCSRFKYTLCVQRFGACQEKVHRVSRAIHFMTSSNTPCVLRDSLHEHGKYTVCPQQFTAELEQIHNVP